MRILSGLEAERHNFRERVQRLALQRLCLELRLKFVPMGAITLLVLLILVLSVVLHGEMEWYYSASVLVCSAWWTLQCRLIITQFQPGWKLSLAGVLTEIDLLGTRESDRQLFNSVAPVATSFPNRMSIFDESGNEDKTVANEGKILLALRNTVRSEKIDH